MTIVDGWDLSDDELRAEAAAVASNHDPAHQGHGYNRCALCHYCSHPCDAYDMAAQVLRLLDRLGAGG